MAWIESHTVLSRHRKLKELALLLRLKPVYAMGHLHALWHDALEQQEDGDLSAWSDELIAESAQFDGDAPKFVSLLQDCGWLDGRLIHDWLEYAGRYLESKYRTSNPKRLIEIWAKHGLVWLESGLRRTKDSPPNQTLPDLTKQKAQAPMRFSKPLPPEVSEYAKSIGYLVDGQAFCDFYESKGWNVGQTPMKDWKACVRTWKKRDSMPVKGEVVAAFPGVKLKPGDDPWRDEFERSEKESHV